MPRKKPNPPPRGGELGKLFDKLPPHDLGAEQACLGSMILSGVGTNVHVIGDVMDVIRSAGDFSLPKNQALYQAMIDCYNAHSAIDSVQLSAMLRERDLYDAIGGTDYLVELAESVPTAVNAVHYADIVRERATLRDLVDASAMTLRECYEKPDQAAEVLDRAEQRVYEISDKGRSLESGSIPMGDHIEAQYLKLEKMHGDGSTITGLPTGYHNLDQMLTGLQPGDIIILAARPSIGKSALMLNIAEYVGINKNAPVGIFSMEMSREQLGLRLLSTRAGVDLQRMRRNMINADELERLKSAAEVIAHSPLFIDDSAGLSIAQLRSRARRMRARDGAELIVVDYLQLMSAQGYQQRHEEVSAISRGLKAIARELDIPLLVLSQLNRESAGRDDKRPRLSELRESGAIEQDADVVILMHREEHYHVADQSWHEEHPELVGRTELIVAKQRNGPVGVVALHWSPGRMRFDSAADPNLVAMAQDRAGFDPAQRD